MISNKTKDAPPSSSSDRISVNFRTNVDNRTRDTNLMINRSDTILHLKEILNGKGIIESINQCKMIFSGKILANDQTFSQVFEHCDTSVTPTIHLIGGLCKNQPESEPTPELKTPSTTPVTPVTPKTPSTPNSYLLLQKQLLLQQQMLMTQMMMNQLILANSPTLVQSAPAGVNLNSSIFSPTVTSTPLSPFSASAFQSSQNIFNTDAVSTPKPQVPETKIEPTSTDQNKSAQEIEGPIIENEPENQEPQQQEIPAQNNIPQQNVAPPQRLIQDNQNQQQGENAYDYIYTFGKVLLVSTVIFAKEGWVTWILCTLGFYFGILLLKYLNNVIHRRVVRDQERREREEQAMLNEETTEEIANDTNVEVATADRGVIGTLIHVIYLFFISLAPTYQPRRRSTREEEQHED